MDIHLSVSVAIPKDGYRSSLRIIDGYYHLGFRIYLFAYEEFVIERMKSQSDCHTILSHRRP